ncbi:MAG: hypothetical protein KGO81_01010 [Bacteroidota bacterium]|nr:hypothetical protein [Bacteroidota bacterium]
MHPLTIRDIREWLIINQAEYKKLKAEKFPPLDNEMYWLYGDLYRIIEFYSLTHNTHIAIQEFNAIQNFDFKHLVLWTKKHEVLGAKKLILFEIDYFDWIEEVDKDLLKIKDGIYMEATPFKETLLFCRIFQILYWNFDITNMELTNEEIKNLQNDLMTLLNNK